MTSTTTRSTRTPTSTSTTGSTPESHSEVLVDYAFECDDPSAIGTLDVALGERFESIETIAVQMAGPGGQGAESLSPEGARVALDVAPVLGDS